MLTEEIQNRWAPILEHEDLPKISDPYRRNVTAVLLENTQKAVETEQKYLTEGPIPVNFMGASSSDSSTGNIDTFDPVLISLVRRAAPVMMSYDIMGVQPMTGPTGLIFAMRARYANQTHTETFYNEVNTAFSSILSGANTFGNKHVGTLPGNSSAIGNSAETGIYNTGTGMSTAQAEALGTDSNAAFAEMAFSIEKVTVTAKSRALKAEYTLELAQDLKAVHGLEAESELANILTTEILAEINREAVRTVNFVAKIGCQENTTTAGFYDLDTDSNGRWSVEKFKGLMFQLERECNAITKDTRRGKGNIAIMTSDVAAALRMAGVLSMTPNLDQNMNMQIDDSGSTFVGILNGSIRCYIDPYSSGGQYITVGYKGPNFTDAGLFYCPYVPLQMVRAVDPSSFIPKIGFKTRYGMVANPFAGGATASTGQLLKDANVYYRKFLVTNLM